MDWATSSEAVRILQGLIRLNTATASACQVAATGETDLRRWRTLLEIGDEGKRFAAGLTDRVARLCGSDWMMPRCGAAGGEHPEAAGSVSPPAGGMLELLRCQTHRRLSVYDEAIHEPLDGRTRAMLRRQREATFASYRRLVELVELPDADAARNAAAA
jgi:hypothetical protein